jgi:hypothetical protein
MSKAIKMTQCTMTNWTIGVDGTSKWIAKQKNFWAASGKQCINPTIMGKPWQMEIRGQKITSNLRDMLCDACSTPKALAYWDTKKRFGPCMVAEIDWDAFGGAMKSTQTKRQHWVSKTISGFV